MNAAIATRLPEKAAELAFYHTSLARRQAKVFEGATTKAANMFAVLFQNFTQLCVLLGLVIVLVLLDRHAPKLVAPIMKGFVARVVHGAPAYETDTWIVILGVLAYMAWTFAKLKQRFIRKEVGRADRPLNM